MKAILVIDMPDEAKAEDYCMRYGLFANKGEKPFRLGEIAFECKNIDLKPLPSFKAVDLNDTRDVVMFCHGWNVCLEEITGGEE